MNLAKKIFRCLGICALACLIIFGFYEMWLIACAFIDSGGFFDKITGFMILLCESAILIFVMMVAVSVVHGWIIKRSRDKDEDDQEDF